VYFSPFGGASAACIGMHVASGSVSIA
jgi:hypothetical protein